MAGKFNKFLNFIGLVDDEPSARGDEYAPERTGRPSTYIPQRTGASRTRRSAVSAQRSLPAQAGRSSDGRVRMAQDAPARRTSTRFDDADDYDLQVRRRTSSRFDEAPAARAPRASFDEAPERTGTPVMERPSQRRSPNRAGASTVVISLVTLRDANKVISALVRGNTIVMTIETDDSAIRQRIVDTLSGAVYALDATIRKASESTYLLAPRTVEVQASYDLDDDY